MDSAFIVAMYSPGDLPVDSSHQITLTQCILFFVFEVLLTTAFFLVLNWLLIQETGKEGQKQ